MSYGSHELVLYADNDSSLYRQKEAFLANMHRKMKRGTYDHAKGRKLWMYYVDRAAKQYAKEFGGTWNKDFPRSDREEAAREYEAGEYRAIQNGEYSKFPPVRSSSGDPRRRRRYR
jgi:hypothetical protein